MGRTFSNPRATAWRRETAETARSAVSSSRQPVGRTRHCSVTYTPAVKCLALSALILAASGCSHDWSLRETSSSTSFCAGRSDPFCDDFEAGTLTDHWDGITKTNGATVFTAVIPEDPVHGLGALDAQVPANDGTSASVAPTAYVFGLLGGDKRASLSFSVHAISVDPGASAVVAQLWFNFQSPTPKVVTVSLVGNVLVGESTGASMPVSLGALAADEWRDVILTVTDTQVVFQSGGRLFQRDKSAWTSPEGIRFAVGLIDQKAPHKAWEVQIDNVAANDSPGAT